MKTPYHTGKVAIGSAYVPSTRPYHDQDAIRLQSALLGHKRQMDASGVLIAAVCAIVIGLPIIHHWLR